MLATLLTCLLLQAPSAPARRPPRPEARGPAPRRTLRHAPVRPADARRGDRGRRAGADTARRRAVRRRVIAAAAQSGSSRVPLAITLRPDGKQPAIHVGPVLEDAALEHAVRSGLPLRLHFRVELWKDRWIDALQGSESWIAILAYDPLAREYLLRAQTDSGPARRFKTYAGAAEAAERAYVPAIGPHSPGRYYYRATLRIETLSLSDLDELEHWLKGELGPAVSGNTSLPHALTDGLKRALIRVLGLPARAYNARTGTFRFP